MPHPKPSLTFLPYAHNSDVPLATTQPPTPPRQPKPPSGEKGLKVSQGSHIQASHNWAAPSMLVMPCFWKHFLDQDELTDPRQGCFSATEKHDLWEGEEEDQEVDNGRLLKTQTKGFTQPQPLLSREGAGKAEAATAPQESSMGHHCFCTWAGLVPPSALSTPTQRLLRAP